MTSWRNHGAKNELRVYNPRVRVGCTVPWLFPIGCLAGKRQKDVSTFPVGTTRAETDGIAGLSSVTPNYRLFEERRQEISGSFFLRLLTYRSGFFSCQSSQMSYTSGSFLSRSEVRKFRYMYTSASAGSRALLECLRDSRGIWGLRIINTRRGGPNEHGILCKVIDKRH